ncbi:BglG family transcription antiterminator [Peribacillus loiseleuriae]|uniref:BglG family transcription antiterminator n=1 Tax=Peribacillus loiseleuriae TaxID=1679170 RepID=UPI00382EA2D5
MSINGRSLQMVDLLIKENDYIKVNYLADFVQTSERNVRYCLKKIDAFLTDNGFEPLVRHHLKGVLLKKNEKLLSFFEEFNCRTTPYLYVYSKEEIRNFMLLKLLLEGKVVPISYFEDVLFISRSTALSHLIVIESEMFLKGLTMKKIPRQGYLISGNTATKCSVFANTFIGTMSIREFYTFIESETNVSKIGELYLFNLFEINDLKLAMALVNEFERKLEQVFDDLSCLILIIFLLKLINGGLKEKQPALTLLEGDGYKLEIIESVLRECVPEERTIKITEPFIAQVAQMIKSLRNISSTQIIDEDLSGLVRMLCNEMGDAYGGDFLENNEKFFPKLLNHISFMVRRIRKGMSLENPVFDQFIEQSYEVYVQTKQACKLLEEQLGIQINDHEVSYIAIYFALVLEKIENKEMRKPNLLIVCVEGLAVSKMLAISIRKLFDIGNIKTISVRSLTKELIDSYDFIISTVNISDVQTDKFIKINSFLVQEDIELLKEHLKLKLTTQKRNDVKKLSRILEVVTDSCDIKNMTKLQFDLINILVTDQYISLPNKPNMQIEFSQETIQLNGKASSWEEAIRLGTKPLLKLKYIDESYEEKIIDNIKNIGPYMVVAPGVILSHAGPDDGVNADSFSLVTIKDGVNFHDRFKTPVKLVLTLAIKSHKNHALVEKLMKLVLDHKKVSEILQSTSELEVYQQIENHIM